MSAESKHSIINRINAQNLERQRHPWMFDRSQPPAAMANPLQQAGPKIPTLKISIPPIEYPWAAVLKSLSDERLDLLESMIDQEKASRK